MQADIVGCGRRVAAGELVVDAGDLDIIFFWSWRCYWGLVGPWM